MSEPGLFRLAEDFGLDPEEPGTGEPGPDPGQQSLIQHAIWAGENLTEAEASLGSAKDELEAALAAARLRNTRKTMTRVLEQLHEVTDRHGDVRFEVNTVIAGLGSGPPPPGGGNGGGGGEEPGQPLKRVFVVYPGGGWMPPGPVPAALLERSVELLEDRDAGFEDADDQDRYNYIMQAIGQFFDSLPNMDYVPGQYRGGTGIEGVARDMAAQLKQLTGRYDRVYVAGHSAGLTALLAILDPKYGVDASKIGGFVSIAGAGLSVRSSDQIRNPMTAQLFRQAWGPPQYWASWSPDTYADRITARFPLVILDGDRDDQLERIWAARGVKTFKDAGWTVWPDPWAPQHGGDHFNMNPPYWPATVALIQRLIA